MTAPRLAVTALPETEQELGRKIDHALTSLDMTIQEFRDTISLLDFAASERSRRMGGFKSSGGHEQTRKSIFLLESWHRIAGRMGAIVLGDFSETINKLKARVQRCPTIKSLVNTRDLEAAAQLFHRALPKIGDIRDASAHPTEPGVNSFDGGYEKHGIKIAEGVVGTTMTGSSGRSFFVTVKEAVQEYELSAETAAKLDTVRDAVHEVFRPAETALMNIYLKQRAEVARNNK